ncbi:MAG TPA: hypothetical protein VF168_08290 [Trueperaceae bacterium]
MAELIGETLRLASGHYLHLEQLPIRMLLAVVFLAGISSAAGQSLVLFVSRVRPHRFIASLLLSAMIFVAGFMLWSLSVWSIGSFAYSREVPYETVLRAIALAYSPYLFSFFVLTPYLGSFIWLLLSIWSLLALVIATGVVLDLTLWQALLCNAGGWLLLQLLERTIGRPVLALTKILRSWVAGTRLTTEAERLARPEGEG